MLKIYLSVFLILVQCYLVNAQVLTIEPLLQSAQAGDRFQGESIAVKGEASKLTSNKLNFTIKSKVTENIHEDPEVELIKKEYANKKMNPIASKLELNITTSDPIITTNFEGPWMVNGTPPDASFGISTTGNIVACNNDGIEYYTSTGSYINGYYWSDFIDDSGLTGKKYDPKVIFDSQNNRFICILLNGSTPDISKVIIAISYSDNPAFDGWYYYSINGDPTNSYLWFDYPSIGQSTKDLFITGNLFSEDGKFTKAVIFQLDKTALYNKQPIKYYYYSNLTNTPFNAFTIMPVSYGLKGNYGPGMYFVSGKSSGATQLRLWYISDAYTGNPKLTDNTINVSEYSVGGNAGQYGISDLLDVGDCRMLSGFYLNGIVHVVHLTNIGDGWNGIGYHRINVANLTAENSTFGLQGSYDYAYPAVVSYANSQNDKSVMIAFLRSGDDIYPQCRVVHCDNNMDWSGSTLVKKGENYVDLLTATTERWGDYTGICRQFVAGTVPTVWMNGSYGADINSKGRKNSYRSWIAKIFAEKTATNERQTSDVTKVFPQPALNDFKFEFELPQAQMVNILLYDAKGDLVKHLFRDYLTSGIQSLSFTTDVLESGIYFLTIKGDKQYENTAKVSVSK